MCVCISRGHRIVIFRHTTFFVYVVFFFCLRDTHAYVVQMFLLEEIKKTGLWGFGYYLCGLI